MSRQELGHRISWTGRTLNPGIFGCTLAGPECLACYAAPIAHRGLGPYADFNGAITKVGPDGVTWTGRVFVDEARIGPAFAALPKRSPTLVFTTSMADLFHSEVPEEFIGRVVVEMAARPHLTFQVLTKRPARMHFLFDDRFFQQWVQKDLQARYPSAEWWWPLPNVWPGTTCGDNDPKRHMRLRELAQVPTAAIRFVSVEPMLQAPDLRGYVETGRIQRGAQALRAGRYPIPGDRDPIPPINHVILGGEAKTNRRAPRPFDLDGARDLIRYLGLQGPDVTVQIKQLGDVWAARAGARSRSGRDPAEWPDDLRPFYGMPRRWARAAGLSVPAGAL